MAKTDTDRAAAQRAAETLPPPERAQGSTGVPADVLEALAIRPDGINNSSPIDLDALLDMDIAAWRPEPGEKVVGTVVNLDIAGNESAFGSYYLLTIRADGTGELVNVHAFHTVLGRELARKSVGQGDRIGIKYLGRVERPGEPDFENYRVVVDRGASMVVTDLKPKR